MFVLRIEWHNPYTSPPDGAPRVLAEMVVERPHPTPSELLAHVRPGYWPSSRYLRPPQRVTPPEKLAARRQKALHKKMSERYPLFAEQFAAEKLDAKPGYYLDGRGQWDEERAAILAEEAAYYAEASGRIGVLVVFAS